MPTLTSLKAPPPPSDYEITPRSPQDQDNIKLNEVRGEIVRLEKSKTSLLGEVKSLERATDLAREQTQSVSEVKRLNRQKTILLGQIKELIGSFDILKSSKDKVLEAYGKFGEERSEALDGIARSLSLEVAKETTQLNNKSTELTAWDQLLTDFADYFGELALICEAESLSVALERANLEKEGKALTLQEESVKSAHNKTKELLSKAEALVWGADDRYQDANSIASFFEEVADEERKKLARASQALSLKEKALKAEKRTLLRQGIELKKKEFKLLDKEKTLQRTAERLRALGAII